MVKRKNISKLAVAALTFMFAFPIGKEDCCVQADEWQEAPQMNLNQDMPCDTESASQQFSCISKDMTPVITQESETTQIQAAQALETTHREAEEEMTTVTVYLPIAVASGAEKKTVLESPAVKKAVRAEVDGAWYTITSVSEMTVRYDGVTKEKSTVKVPATVKINEQTYTVTSIAKNAFKNDTMLKYISIPDTIESVGVNAFKGCTKLRKLRLPSGVTYVEKDASKGSCKKSNVTEKKTTDKNKMRYGK